MTMSGTAKPASTDTGSRVCSLRLAIGYAVMAAALAATLLGSFALGSHRKPAVNAAGVYRLDPPAPCLGRQVEVRQSGRFADIAGERDSTGRLEVDHQQLSGQVRCADGSTASLQATVVGEAGHRSLTGELGGHHFRTTPMGDRPGSAEVVVASGEPLAPEALFGRLMLAIAAVIVAARAVGALAARIGQPKVFPRLVARLRGTTDEETRRCILGVDLLDRQPPRLPWRAR